MKYKDIPSFTSIGDYEVNVRLSSFDSTIKEYQENGLQLNPDFQRGHVWSLDQQISFIEFLLMGGKTANTIYFNQAGWMSDWEGDFVCVDGLQRTTALLDFLHNKVPVFGGNYLKDFDFPNRILMAYTVKININNLKTRKEVLKWYLEFNTGGTVHSKEEIERVKKLYEEEIK